MPEQLRREKPPVVIVRDEKAVKSLKRRKVHVVCVPDAGELNGHFDGADVVLIPTNDNAGFLHVGKIGAALAGQARRVRVLMLPDGWNGTAAEFRKLVDQAPDWVPAPSPDVEPKARAEAEEQALIDALARLGPLDYARRRKQVAEDLGVNIGDVNDAVRGRREEIEQEAAKTEPPDHGHWIVEPWPESVDGAELLSALVDRILRHHVITRHNAVAVALWILLTWMHAEVATHSPILLITSAVPGEGKTSLMCMVSLLALRGYVAAHTTASIYEDADRLEPSLGVDDADTFFGDTEKLRQVINSSWTKATAFVRRGVGMHRKRYSTWCPKFFGMIGRKLPASTLQRCVVIAMSRNLPDEQYEKFRNVDDPELGELRAKCLRWSVDNMEAVRAAMAGTTGRGEDNWELQLAVADVAGGEWPALAREAADADLAARAEDDEPDLIKLLADSITILEAANTGREHSDRIAAVLRAMEGRPWATWQGRGLSKWQMAEMFSRFIPPIKPIHSMRIGNRVGGGYELGQFEKHRLRYLKK
jgi:putative DNA primase/helicase